MAGQIDGPAESPDGLGFQTRPTGITRINRKVGVVLACVLVVVVGGIVAGVVARQTVTGPYRAGTESVARLEPASQAGEQFTRDIPDGNLPNRKARDDRARATVLAPPAGVIEVPGKDTSTTPPGASVPPLLPMPHGKAGPSMSSVPSAGSSAPVSRGATSMTMPVDPEQDGLRRLREERQARIKQAMEAGTGAQTPGHGAALQFANGTPAAPLSALQQLQALSTSSRNGLPMVAPPSIGTRDEDDPNKQARKEQFLRDMEAPSDRSFVKSTRTAGLTPFEIKAGWLIPATMQHGINSDLPGQISAVVSQNVWDSASGRHLLIPQGAVLLGTYDQQIAYGQNGLLVVWRRIIYPDASALELEGMGGVDQSGYAGFRDQVDNHYMRLLGFGLMTSLFSSAFQISQGEKQGVNGAQTPSQVAGAAVAQQLSQLGIEIARKNLRVQPTIEVRPGYQFFVRVEKDLAFTRPYSYGNAR